MLGWAMMLALAQAAAAPGDPPSPPAPAACAVADANVTRGGSPDLYVACGSATASLGGADQYGSSYSAVLDAMLVSRQVDGRTVVSLVTHLPTGNVQVDDVSRELAVLATGSSVTRPILQVDLSAFATNGSVAVSVQGGASSSLDLTPYVSRAKALAAAAGPVAQDSSAPVSSGAP